jgi:hypothetical protein
MGFFKKITRGISVRNISPVVRANAPIVDAIKEVKTSSIVDVVMDKPIVPNEVVKPIKDIPTTPTTPATPTSLPTITPAVAVAPEKKKPNTLMYAGIGVGVLVLGYFGYKLMKK